MGGSAPCPARSNMGQMGSRVEVISLAPSQSSTCSCSAPQGHRDQAHGWDESCTDINTHAEHTHTRPCTRRKSHAGPGPSPGVPRCLQAAPGCPVVAPHGRAAVGLRGTRACGLEESGLGHQGDPTRGAADEPSWGTDHVWIPGSDSHAPCKALPDSVTTLSAVSSLNPHRSLHCDAPPDSYLPPSF